MHDLADGDANREASEELHKLIETLQKDADLRNAVSKGRMVIKIAASVDPRGVVTFGWDIERREPKPPRTGGVMWIGKDGQLTPQNPRQEKLPLYEVAGREPTIDDFDPHTGEVRKNAREV